MNFIRRLFRLGYEMDSIPRRCRTHGHNFQTIVYTGVWEYRECSRCGERSVIYDQDEQVTNFHPPDQEWLSVVNMGEEDK